MIFSAGYFNIGDREAATGTHKRNIFLNLVYFSLSRCAFVKIIKIVN
jgi:hypothetical protein